MKVISLSLNGMKEATLAVTLPHSNKSMEKLMAEYSVLDSIGKSLLARKRILLLSKLVKAGPDHSKAVRGITMTFLIEAPRYWWSQMDTYTIGKTPLSSTSTMHKLGSKELYHSNFEGGAVDNVILNRINDMIKDKESVSELKKVLPESFLQIRVLVINYQSLRNIYYQRKHHRLKEWKEFITAIEECPYAAELITINKHV